MTKSGQVLSTVLLSFYESFCTVLLPINSVFKSFFYYIPKRISQPKACPTLNEWPTLFKTVCCVENEPFSCCLQSDHY